MGQSLHSNKLETSRHADKTGSKLDKSIERQKRGAVILSLFAADLCSGVVWIKLLVVFFFLTSSGFRSWEVTCTRKKI